MRQILLAALGVVVWTHCYSLSAQSTSSSSKLDSPIYKQNELSTISYHAELQGVLGQPGIDFPVLTFIPNTRFTCTNAPSGYYADVETDCQVFHICDEGHKISFLCPNGTIFQQSDLICEWWFKVNCSESPNFYEDSAEHLHEERIKFKQYRKVKLFQSVNKHQAESEKSSNERTLLGEPVNKLDALSVNARFSDRTFVENSKEAQEFSESASFVKHKDYVQFGSALNGLSSTQAPLGKKLGRHPNHNYDSNIATTQHSFYSPTVPQITKSTTQSPIHSYATARTKPCATEHFTRKLETDAFAAPKSHYFSSIYPHTTGTPLTAVSVPSPFFNQKQQRINQETVKKLPISVQTNINVNQTEVKRPKNFVTHSPVESSTVPDAVVHLQGAQLQTSSATPFISHYDDDSKSNSYNEFPESNGKLSTSKYTYLPHFKVTLTNDIQPTTPTYYFSENKPKHSLMSENVMNMIKTLEVLDPSDALKELDKNSDPRPGLEIPPSAGPNTLHSLAIYFASALDDIVSNNNPADDQDDHQTTEKTDMDDQKSDVEPLLTKSTQEKFNLLFNGQKSEDSNVKEVKASSDSSDGSHDLVVEQSRGIGTTPRIRQLAQVFTHALAAYLDDPITFKRVLQEIRPTEPPVSSTESTLLQDSTATVHPQTTEDIEVLDFSDADKPSTILPILNTKQGYNTHASHRSVQNDKLVSIPTYQPYFTPTNQRPSNSLASSHVYSTPTPNPLALDLNTAIESTGLPSEEITSDDNLSIEDVTSAGSYFPLSNERDEEYEKRKVTAKPYGHGVKPESTPIHEHHQIPPTPLKWSEFQTEPVNVLLPPFVTLQRTDEFRKYTLNTTENQNEEYLQSAHSQAYGGRFDNVRHTKSEAATISKEPVTRPTLQPIIVDDSSKYTVQTTLHPPISGLFAPSAAQNLDKSGRSTLNLENHWTRSSAVTKLWRDTLYVNPLTINIDLQNQLAKIRKYSLIKSTTEPIAPETTTPLVESTTEAFTETPTTYKSTFTNSASTNILHQFLTKNTNEKYQSLTSSSSNVLKEEVEAKELFGALNSTEKAMLMEKMKEADSNSTVRHLILLLVNTCKDKPQNNRNVEDTRDAILHALLDGDHFEDLDKNRYTIADLTSAGSQNDVSSRKERDNTNQTSSNVSKQPKLEHPLLLSNASNSSTPSSSHVKTIVIDPLHDGPPEEADNDTRALELLRTLYAVAAKWG